MIIPSIDLVAGRAVQTLGGETGAIDAGDPVPSEAGREYVDIETIA